MPVTQKKAAPKKAAPKAPAPKRPAGKTAIQRVADAAVAKAQAVGLPAETGYRIGLAVLDGGKRPAKRVPKKS